MNMTENLQRKENGIIFDKVGIPNYAGAANIALWKADCANYVRGATNSGIEIERMPPTIVELRNRLTEIIDDNDRQGWSERNQSSIVTVIQASTRVRELYATRYACGAWTGIGDNNVFELVADDKPIARYGGNLRKGGK